MNWLEVLVLALLQGATEFLPISSSAHLILAPVLLGWEDQGHAFDVAVHVGTLLAMLSYFRRELGAMLRAVMAGETPESESARYLAAWLVVATIPIVSVGAAMFSVVSTDLREVQLIAWMTLGFGILLWVADAQGSRARTEEQLRWSDAVWIGSAQCLALVPGVSRAGIVMTAALVLGLQRTAAARVAFLLAIPTIAAAGALSLQKSLHVTQAVDWGALILGAVIAGISAWLCIHFFLRLIERIGMMPFALYRVVLGGLLLAFH